jgi:hypothetical protein
MGILILLIAIWLGVHWSFMALMYAKTLPLSLYWKVHVYPLALIGIVLDVLFNLIFGTLMFRERPHEWLFTDRIQRHFNTSSGRRHWLASFWARNLNLVDPGHV